MLAAAEWLPSFLCWVENLLPYGIYSASRTFQPSLTFWVIFSTLFPRVPHVLTDSWAVPEHSTFCVVNEILFCLRGQWDTIFYLQLNIIQHWNDSAFNPDPTSASGVRLIISLPGLIMFCIHLCPCSILRCNYNTLCYNCPLACLPLQVHRVSAKSGFSFICIGSLQHRLGYWIGN